MQITVFRNHFDNPTSCSLEYKNTIRRPTSVIITDSIEAPNELQIIIPINEFSTDIVDVGDTITIGEVLGAYEVYSMKESRDEVEINATDSFALYLKNRVTDTEYNYTMPLSKLIEKVTRNLLDDPYRGDNRFYRVEFLSDLEQEPTQAYYTVDFGLPLIDFVFDAAKKAKATVFIKSQVVQQEFNENNLKIKSYIKIVYNHKKAHLDLSQSSNYDIEKRRTEFNEFAFNWITKPADDLKTFQSLYFSSIFKKSQTEYYPQSRIEKSVGKIESDRRLSVAELKNLLGVKRILAIELANGKNVICVQLNPSTPPLTLNGPPGLLVPYCTDNFTARISKDFDLKQDNIWSTDTKPSFYKVINSINGNDIVRPFGTGYMRFSYITNDDWPKGFQNTTQLIEITEVPVSNEDFPYVGWPRVVVDTGSHKINAYEMHDSFACPNLLLSICLSMYNVRFAKQLDKDNNKLTVELSEKQKEKYGVNDIICVVNNLCIFKFLIKEKTITINGEGKTVDLDTDFIEED